MKYLMCVVYAAAAVGLVFLLAVLVGRFIEYGSRR